jgi:hypothetical protein
MWQRSGRHGSEPESGTAAVILGKIITQWWLRFGRWALQTSPPHVDRGMVPAPEATRPPSARTRRASTLGLNE